jgi:hypothetical protein
MSVFKNDIKSGFYEKKLINVGRLTVIFIMNLSRCLKNEIMSGRHCVILFKTLCRHKKNDIMSARHYFIFLPTQFHKKNDTPSVKSSIQKITDIMSKKSPTLCQPTLIQGANKNTGLFMNYIDFVVVSTKINKKLNRHFSYAWALPI